jgi:hypothetical protein
MSKYISIIYAMMITTIAFGFIQKRKLTIDGVWKIVEVQTVKPDGSFTSVSPKESQVIFTHDSYSFCWTSHTSTIRNWQMPDTMKLSRINQTIVNAGTYEIKGSILTTKASFAMNPMFVDGLAQFKCSLHGDTLILTGTAVISSDNILNPVYVSGSHIVNKLVRTKNSK